MTNYELKDELNGKLDQHNCNVDQPCENQLSPEHHVWKEEKLESPLKVVEHSYTCSYDSTTAIALSPFSMFSRDENLIEVQCSRCSSWHAPASFLGRRRLIFRSGKLISPMYDISDISKTIIKEPTLPAFANKKENSQRSDKNPSGNTERGEIILVKGLEGHKQFADDECFGPMKHQDCNSLLTENNSPDSHLFSGTALSCSDTFLKTKMLKKQKEDMSSVEAFKDFPLDEAFAQELRNLDRPLSPDSLDLTEESNRITNSEMFHAVHDNDICIICKYVLLKSPEETHDNQSHQES